MKYKMERQSHVNSLSKTNLKSKRLEKLQTKEYRDAYVEAQLSIEIPFQIRALRKQREWTQAQLAELCDIPQARISHIEQPGRDPLSLRTLYRLASAFDVGLLIQFVPFRELMHREALFNPETFSVSSFEDDQLETTAYYYTDQSLLLMTQETVDETVYTHNVVMSSKIDVRTLKTSKKTKFYMAMIGAEQRSYYKQYNNFTNEGEAWPENQVLPINQRT